MSEGEFPKDRRTAPKPLCPDCETLRMRRLPRVGFCQLKFWPLLGMYPWECPTCRKLRLVRYRGKRGEYAPHPERQDEQMR